MRVGDGAWVVLAASEPLRIDEVGSTAVSYRSTDAAGNVESAHEVVVEITEPEPPTVELGSTRVTAGGSLGVTGAGFVPGEAVRVSLRAGDVVLGTLVADAEGRVEGVVNVPPSMKPGKHRLELAGVESDRAVEAKLIVTGGGRRP